MSISPQIKSHKDRQRLISSSRLQEAFASLRAASSLPGVPFNEIEKARNLESAYRSMLRFMADGVIDPSSDTLLSDIKESLYRLNDLILRASLYPLSADSYSAAKRMEMQQNASLESRLRSYALLLSQENTPDEISRLSLERERFNSLRSLFNHVWTMFGAPASDYSLLGDAFKQQQLPAFSEALLISALVLGNSAYFDSQAMTLLLDIFENAGDSELKWRALSAVALVVLMHPHRVSNLPSLSSRIRILMEDEDFKNGFNDVLLEIIRTFDTKRVTTRMRDELIPGLMKINPEILNRMRNMAEESEDFLSDSNPEWEDIIENSGVQDKIQEISDMQMEGSDVMMTTFSNLKTFSFFNDVYAWFLPFVSSHPELGIVRNLFEDEDIFRRLRLAMCDSDVNSFVLSMGSMPSAQRTLMIKNLQQQLSQAEELLTSPTGDDPATARQRIIRHYLQDLYRFFNLYRKKEDFHNPFESPLDADSLEAVMNIIPLEAATVKRIADFYFNHEYYPLAAGMWMLFDNIYPGNHEVWEKIGFSFDRSSQFADAVKWYRKAEIVTPDSKWLMKKLAVSLKNLGEYGEAVKYYDKVLESEPENYHVLMSAGQCLLEVSDFEHALQHFFHASYLKPEKRAPLRAIAWTRLISFDLSKAKEDYARLTSEKADKTDLLNAALCDMASRDIPCAIEYYRRYLSLTEGNDFRELITALRDDVQILKELDIPFSSLRLVVDKLRYDLL